MIWSRRSTQDDINNDDITRTTINSVPNIPPTPTPKNVFTRAFNSLFGTTDDTEPVTQIHTRLNSDISVPFNQSMRSFNNIKTPEKQVNWIDEFNDSDEDLNETIHSIRNLKSSSFPGTYPEQFPSPYIPQNYKIDQDNSQNRDILDRYLLQSRETNSFLEELLNIQQFDKKNHKEQTVKYLNLKKELTIELENSKQVYEGFHRLLLKYKSLKEQLKSYEINSPNLSDKDLKFELESTKRLLLSKTKRIEELERDLKRLTDQRDDLKTTILEYKNQNLRLKNSNELLTNENNNLLKRDNDFDKISVLNSKNEMLETQITKSNEMFKDQTNKLKNQVLDLQSDLKREREIHDFEIKEKNKRILELESMLKKPQRGILSDSNRNTTTERPKSHYRSELLKDDTENLFQKDEFTISDISQILQNNQSEDLTGFDNDRVTRRLMKRDPHNLNAIFDSV